MPGRPSQSFLGNRPRSSLVFGRVATRAVLAATHVGHDWATSGTTLSVIPDGVHVGWFHSIQPAPSWPSSVRQRTMARGKRLVRPSSLRRSTGPKETGVTSIPRSRSGPGPGSAAISMRALDGNPWVAEVLGHRERRGGIDLRPAVWMYPKKTGTPMFMRMSARCTRCPVVETQGAPAPPEGPPVPDPPGVVAVGPARRPPSTSSPIVTAPRDRVTGSHNGWWRRSGTGRPRSSRSGRPRAPPALGVPVNNVVIEVRASGGTRTRGRRSLGEKAELPERSDQVDLDPGVPLVRRGG